MSRKRLPRGKDIEPLAVEDTPSAGAAYNQIDTAMEDAEAVNCAEDQAETGRPTSQSKREHDIESMAEEIEHIGDLPTSEPNSSWLQTCRQMQSDLFGAQYLAQGEMGTWELDLLHSTHECYNIGLFKNLIPSSQEEREKPAHIFGYGTVELRVLYDRNSTVWHKLILDNVRYIQADPRTTNNRIGFSALPDNTHLHIPDYITNGIQGDGFLSMSSHTGCALGQMNQGGRKFWALRTLQVEHPDTQRSQKAGFMGNWYGAGRPQGGGDKRKREQEAGVGSGKRSRLANDG